MKIDQEQNSSVRLRLIPIVKWSIIYLVLCILISHFRFGIVSAESLYLRESDQSLVSAENPLRFIKRLEFSPSKTIQNRSRADLLNELDDLSGQITWRSHDQHHFSQANIYDRTVMLNRLFAQQPMRKPGLMIIGDSLSATRHFITCLHEHHSKEIDHWSSLIEPWTKRKKFSVFQRESLAAQHGATTWDLFKSIQFKTKLGYGRARYLIQAPSLGPSSPLLQELYHNSARYASLLIGTNDLLYHRGLERFSWRYIQIIETLKDQGVIPLAQTLPPQMSKASAQGKDIVTFNRLIEVIANVERIPLIDLYTPLSKLNHKGLRADGIHLNAYSGGCRFSKKGLRFGQNLRNKLVFESLFKVHKARKYIGDHSRITKRAKILMSVIKETDQALKADSDCMKEIHKVSQKPRRWKLIRRGYKETKSTYHDVPIEGYGTWYSKAQTFEVYKHHSQSKLITLLSPGAKRDRSREQAWLKLANGSCVELKNISTDMHLPVGKHKFIHVFRKTPLVIGPKDSRPIHRVQGKAIFAW